MINPNSLGVNFPQSQPIKMRQIDKNSQTLTGPQFQQLDGDVCYFQNKLATMQDVPKEEKESSFLGKLLYYGSLAVGTVAAIKTGKGLKGKNLGKIFSKDTFNTFKNNMKFWKWDGVKNAAQKAFDKLPENAQTRVSDAINVAKGYINKMP